jgi:AcrR family transcriptional regulator
MAVDRQDERRRRIERAAFEVLTEVGYRRASMLQIAKRAQASNETLYAWYGNKQTLFGAIIEENGRAVRGLLEAALERHDDPLRTLETLGPVLLRFTTDEMAIAMNRAAVADAAETGVLAAAIDAVARGRIFPLITALMARLEDTGVFRLDSGPENAAGTYVSLLLGEIQFRQALGTLAPFGKDDVERQAETAFRLACRLYGGERAPRPSARHPA